MMRVQVFTMVCAAVVVATQPVLANGAGQQDAATLYIDSVALPKKAAICAAHRSDFKDKFGIAFANWRKAYKAELTAGEAQLRADAKTKNIPFPANIEMETDSVAQFLQMAEPAVIKERCADILAELSAR